MNLTGKEKASLCVEKDKKPVFTICQLNWSQLLNSVIVNQILSDLKKNGDTGKIDTRYIMINDMKLSSKTAVRVKFCASLKQGLPGMENNKYDAVNDRILIKDLYNHIIELFEFYAHELDTDIDNIQLELVQLEIVDGKPLTRIKICCSDNDYFNDYIDTIKKYSTDDVSIKKDENNYWYVDLYVDSLDFLLQFVKDIEPINSSKYGHDGFIFTMIEEDYYCIEIYNGWIE